MIMPTMMMMMTSMISDDNANDPRQCHDIVNDDSNSGTCDFTPVSSLTLARSAAR